MNRHSITQTPPAAPPPDDKSRPLILVDADSARPHLGVAGDTYTTLLSGDDTDGTFCLIDMHVPPGGGPPPHRHDYAESFTLLEGEIEVTCRGQALTARAGQTVLVPANAPHAFKNVSDRPARMLCICGPAGGEELFAEIGVEVADRTTPPPKPDGATAAAGKAKAMSLATKYHTEFLKP